MICKLLNKFLPIIFISILLSNAFAQEDITYEPAQVTITVPPGWFYEIDGEMLTVQTSDTGMVLVFLMIPASEINAAMEVASEELAKQYIDIEFTDEVERTVNGLASYYFNANAKLADGGDEIFITCELVDTPGEYVMFIHGAANQETIKKFENDIELIFNSIRPM
jgi:hypothetical protein